MRNSPFIPFFVSKQKLDFLQDVFFFNFTKNCTDLLIPVPLQCKGKCKEIRFVELTKEKDENYEHQI